jgi:lipoprotein-anchoring transpeptidase ErfK/SrfK
MIVRVAGGLVAALSLATFAGEAAAQYGPQQSPYPQSQYRGAPLPDDDDDVPSYRVPAPGPYGRQPSPYSREADRGLYGPDYRPRPPADLRDPYSQRYDTNPTATIPSPYGIERRPYPPPPGSPQQPDYAGRPGQEPQPGYGVRPTQEPQPGYAGRPGQEPQAGYAGRPSQDGYGRPAYDVPPGYARPGQDVPGTYSGRPSQDPQPGFAGRPLPDMTPTARPPMDVTPGRSGTAVASLPPGDEPETGTPQELPAHLKRQTVQYQTREPAGTIIIDTANTHLYLVLGNGQAMRYGIGVGREGFTWSGRERVSRMAEWPDWHPPAEMIERQPYLPRFMAGGEGNPLGARALYLGKTLFRIHGTNQPSTIGKFVSSGCVRLLNEDIEDLYGRVNVGSQVVVLPGKPPATAQQLPQQQPTVQR